MNGPFCRGSGRDKGGVPVGQPLVADSAKPLIIDNFAAPSDLFVPTCPTLVPKLVGTNNSLYINELSRFPQAVPPFFEKNATLCHSLIFKDLAGTVEVLARGFWH